ncbi:MAG: hypothetical protein JNK97_06655 [Zoogloea sp.]|nr:hypothetical protein [Zoogloea sp.]
MLRLALLATLALLAGCASPDRNFYEGIRQENARRQHEPGRDISRDAPPPGYDAYEKERQRLKEESPK